MLSVISSLIHSSFLVYAYYCILSLLIILLGLNIQPHKSSLLFKDNAYFWCSSLLLIIARLPSILFKTQLNIDESQIITQALTLLDDPIYWRSVDGTTIGPIHSYLLMWPGLLKIPITYTTARLTGTALLVVTLWFLFCGMKLAISTTATRLGLLCFLLYLCYTTHFDFLHYSSELLALPVLAFCWLSFIRFNKQPTYATKPIAWLLVGFIGGLIPFIKLQAIPPIAIIILGLFISQLKTKPYKLWPLNKGLLLLFLGGISPSIIVIILCYLYHVSEKFYLFYIESNLFNYGEYYLKLFPNIQLPIWQRFVRLPLFFSSEPTFYTIFLVLVTTSLLACILRVIKHKKIANIDKWIIGWSFGWLLMSLYSVAKPGTEFIHHLWLVAIPISWLLGLSIQGVLSSIPIHLLPPLRLAGAVIIVNLLIVTTILIRFHDDPEATNPYLYAIQVRKPLEISPVSQVLRKHIHANDKLVVWGWNMQYHVENQLPQGTSENHSFRSIALHTLRNAYQEKYLTDMQANKPTFFLDATGPNSLFMSDTVLYKHENFPQLAHYVASHYTLIKFVDHVRIYLRNDRVASHENTL